MGSMIIGKPRMVKIKVTTARKNAYPETFECCGYKIDESTGILRIFNNRMVETHVLRNWELIERLPSDSEQ